MKAIVTTSLLYLLCTSFAIAATTEEGQRITRLTEQTPKALTTNFTGKASSISMFSARAPMQANGAYVTFEPGARTYWHEHPTGQSLVILEGEGWIGEEGKPKTLVHAGRHCCLSAWGEALARRNRQVANEALCDFRAPS